MDKSTSFPLKSTPFAPQRGEVKCSNALFPVYFFSFSWGNI